MTDRPKLRLIVYNVGKYGSFRIFVAKNTASHD